MGREWAIHVYKTQLDSAIEGERWAEADRVRVATKRRFIELIGNGSDHDEIAAARDSLADSFDRLCLSKQVRIDKGALAMATRLLADAETAGIAAEQVPLRQDTARDVKERIIQILSSGNRRPWSTSELATETGKRVETVARALSQLRADRKIVSRREGRRVLHRRAEPQRHALWKALDSTVNAPLRKDLGSISMYESVIRHSSGQTLDRGQGDRPAKTTSEHISKSATLRDAGANLYTSLESLLSQPDAGPTGSSDRMAIIGTKAPLVSVI